MAAEPQAKKPVTCDEVLVACDEAVSRAEVIIDKQGLLIQAYDAQNSQLNRSLEEANRQIRQEQAWYKKPSVVFPAAFVAGIVTTIFAVRQVNK